jgi:hypothetical protein
MTKPLEITLTAEQRAALGNRILVALAHVEGCIECDETFTAEEQRAYDPDDNDHCPKCHQRGTLTTFYGPNADMKENDLGDPTVTFVKVVDGVSESSIPTPIATNAEKRIRDALYQLNMHAGKHPDVSAAISDLEDLVRTSCLEGSYVLDEDETHALVQFVTFREVAAEQAVLRVCKRIEKLRAEGTTKASPLRDECADYEAVCTELGLVIKCEGFADHPAPISNVIAHLRGMRRGLDERQAVGEIFGRFLVELFPNLRAKGNGPDHAESIVRQARAIVAKDKERAAAGLPSDEDFKAFIDRRLKVLADQLENDFRGARDAARAPVEEETLARMRAHPREQADALRPGDIAGSISPTHDTWKFAPPFATQGSVIERIVRDVVDRHGKPRSAPRHGRRGGDPMTYKLPMTVIDSAAAAFTDLCVADRIVVEEQIALREEWRARAELDPRAVKERLRVTGAFFSQIHRSEPPCVVLSTDAGQRNWLNFLTEADVMRHRLLEDARERINEAQRRISGITR